MTSEALPDVLVPASRSRFAHKARALLGIQAVAGVSHDQFVRGVTEWHHVRVGELVDHGARLRVGVRIDGSEAWLQESMGAYFPEPIAPLDGFATIDVERDHPTAATLEELVGLVHGVAHDLGGLADPTRSFAMAGLVNLVRADEGPFAMMLMCTHHPDVDLAATHAWWCSFGEVVAEAPPGPTLGYHQVQCDPDLSRRAASSAGLAQPSFDLGDLLYLRSIEDFVERARLSAGVRADPGPPVNQRDRFITFRGSVGAFCAVV